MHFSKRTLITTLLLGMIQLGHAANPLEKIIEQEAEKLQQRNNNRAPVPGQPDHRDGHGQHQDPNHHHGQRDRNTTCQDETRLRSVQGQVHTTLHFSNKRDHEVRVYWLDYNGRRVFYKAIPAKGRHTQATYQTHPWVVTDQRGNCIGLFVSQQPTATAEIR